MLTATGAQGRAARKLVELVRGPYDGDTFEATGCGHEMRFVDGDAVHVYRQAEPGSYLFVHAVTIDHGYGESTIHRGG